MLYFACLCKAGRQKDHSTTSLSPYGPICAFKCDISFIKFTVIAFIGFVISAILTAVVRTDCIKSHCDIAERHFAVLYWNSVHQIRYRSQFPRKAASPSVFITSRKRQHCWKWRQIEFGCQRLNTSIRHYGHPSLPWRQPPPDLSAVITLLHFVCLFVSYWKQHHSEDYLCIFFDFFEGDCLGSKNS